MRQRSWSHWGASVIGPAHRREGIPNQDAWAARRMGEGIAVVVSDGIGSCAHAEVGARAACRAVLEAAGLHFSHPPVTLAGMPVLVHHLWTLWLAGHAPADCSATCLFVVAQSAAGALIAQLGDGMIAACRGDGAVDLLMPEKCDSFTNVTVGLASGNAATQWRTMTVPEDRYCAFVLCTDGIADDLEPSTRREFAQGVFAHYRPYGRRARRREIQRWLSTWPVPGHTDDKTIACIYRTEGTHE